MRIQLCFVTALISQNHRLAAQLRHHQIRAAVSPQIRNRDRPRLIQFDGVETHILGYVPPALAAQISQQPDFRSTTGFSCRDEIKPSVVVVVQSRDSPPALPAKIRSATRSQPLPFHIAPQTDPWRACVRNARSIQPSLSKSNAITPTAGGKFSFLKSMPESAVNFPSRGFR